MLLFLMTFHIVLFWVNIAFIDYKWVSTLVILHFCMGESYADVLHFCIVHRVLHDSLHKLVCQLIVMWFHALRPLFVRVLSVHTRLTTAMCKEVACLSQSFSDTLLIIGVRTPMPTPSTTNWWPPTHMWIWVKISLLKQWILTKQFLHAVCKTTRWITRVHLCINNKEALIKFS